MKKLVSMITNLHITFSRTSIISGQFPKFEQLKPPIESNPKNIVGRVVHQIKLLSICPFLPSIPYKNHTILSETSQIKLSTFLLSSQLPLPFPEAVLCNSPAYQNGIHKDGDDFTCRYCRRALGRSSRTVGLYERVDQLVTLPELHHRKLHHHTTTTSMLHTACKRCPLAATVLVPGPERWGLVAWSQCQPNPGFGSAPSLQSSDSFHQQLQWCFSQRLPNRTTRFFKQRSFRTRV